MTEQDDEIDALLDAALGPPPEKKERDIEELINGAMRAYTGEFMMTPDRKFYADGRTEMKLESFEKLGEAIRLQLETATQDPPREALPAIAGIRRCIDLLEHELVALARSFGWPWTEIGRALGVSRSAAHRRFAQVEVDFRRRRAR